MNRLEIRSIIDRADSSALVTMLSKSALKLNQNQINTVQFTFWLIYMVETDLNDAIKEAWNLATSSSREEVVLMTKKLLQEGIKGEKKLDPENLKYFSDKIKIYESFYKKDNRTKLLWKLNDLRNDLSHNKINELKYKGNNLIDINVRKQLLKDYFETTP